MAAIIGLSARQAEQIRQKLLEFVLAFRFSFTKETATQGEHQDHQDILKEEGGDGIKPPPPSV